MKAYEQYSPMYCCLFIIFPNLVNNLKVKDEKPYLHLLHLIRRIRNALSHLSSTLIGASHSTHAQRFFQIYLQI